MPLVSPLFGESETKKAQPAPAHKDVLPILGPTLILLAIVGIIREFGGLGGASA